MQISVIVATHKRYSMPTDPMYLPVQAGSALYPALPYQPDSTGDNISERNPNYCELTCLYWAWKNLDSDYIGLCHYRRYFSGRYTGEKADRILSAAQAQALLKKAPILLPRKRHYWIETNYSQYAHAHHAADLDTARDVLARQSPEYLPAFDRSMKRTCGHRFNLFLMRKDLLDRYCTWLFGVLFQLERCLDISQYSANDRRVFGFVSERLLDVWLETNGVPYVECPVVNLESQHWFRKGFSFLKRKFSAPHRGAE